MKKKALILAPLILILVAVTGFIIYTVYKNNIPSIEKQTSANPRQVLTLAINPNLAKPQPVTVAANKLPTFTIDLNSQKFQKIKNLSASELKDYVKANIVHTSFAKEKIETEVEIDKSKNALIIRPEDVPNFKPGMYKLHLTLRTLEGDVNIEQDFAWGVVAVNTNKSIYKPGEVAKIGIGVLNDDGETLCKTGILKVDDINMTIIDPDGNPTNFSLSNNTIKDSGKCGPITVTNIADFGSTYQTSGPGVYQMKVEAIIRGEQREIEDYFKVEENIPFDIERTSFPTRIYPHPPYPVTFIITAEKDYQGTVEEIVPANFKIGNISDKGRLEKFGDFTKIIWNVNLKAGTPKEFTYFIYFPRISPEFYLLGPIKIGNFKEARQWQIASDAINSTTGLVAYEDNGGSNTWSRIWTGTAWNPAPPAAADSMSTTPADSRWFSVKSSPVTNEKLVALEDATGTGGDADEYYVFTWDGAAWNLDLNVGISCNHTETKSFDIAYEETSGDALFVYDDCTNQLKYYRRSSGAWDPSASNAGTGMDSLKNWVLLRPKANTDDILLGYLNTNERIGSLIWDGASNTFGDQLEDDDSPSMTEATSSDEQTFDLAWETQSGTPMIFWGVGSTNKVMYREFSSGSWQSEQDLYTTNFTADVEWVTAYADPRSTSNYIALAFQESDSGGTETAQACEFGMWDGSAGITRPSEVTCRSDFDGRLNTVAFESSSGRAMWVYGIREGVSGTAGDSIAYRTWTYSAGDETDWTSSSTVASTALGNLESIQLHADPNTNNMIALTGDSDGDLNAHYWDGSSWVTDTTDLHSNIQNAGENAEAYGFGFDRFLETLAAYKFFANDNSTDVGSALAPQDNPIIFSTANPDFRLRILLYIDPDDSVGSSGRTYTLQYVDPGSGTCASPGGDGTPASWTDVPASGGTTISFNDNATPSDGSNLTTNASDPTYSGKTVRPQTYEESNTFTNSTSAISGDQAGLWDLSLQDNTTFDNTSQTFCFRVMNGSGRVLKTNSYPQITTSSIPDALIQGGSLIQGGTILQ